MTSLIQEILHEMDNAAGNCNSGQCGCKHCQTKKSRELVHFKLGLPARSSAFNTEFELASGSIMNCLRKIPGLSVLPSSKATEINLELEAEIISNRARGNAFRDLIASQLRKCISAATGGKFTLQVEGQPRGFAISEKVQIAGDRGSGMRYIDIRILKGQKILANIETKLGDSRYHRLQKDKDLALQKNRRGQGIVVRGCTPGSNHPDCRNVFPKLSRPLSKEVSLAEEMLQELETGYHG